MWCHVVLTDAPQEEDLQPHLFDAKIQATLCILRLQHDLHQVLGSSETLLSSGFGRVPVPPAETHDAFVHGRQDEFVQIPQMQLGLEGSLRLEAWLVPGLIAEILTTTELTVSALQLTCLLASGIQRFSGSVMRFGDSPVTIDIMMSKPKEVPSSVRLTVLPHDLTLESSSFGEVKVETNVSRSAWRRGSATLRLRLFHMSKCALRFMLALCGSFSVTRFGAWLALTAA
jgi:hypothetical protein